jgi:hypothetical protein
MAKMAMLDHLERMALSVCAVYKVSSVHPVNVVHLVRLDLRVRSVCVERQARRGLLVQLVLKVPVETLAHKVPLAILVPSVQEVPPVCQERMVKMV